MHFKNHRNYLLSRRKRGTTEGFYGEFIGALLFVFIGLAIIYAVTKLSGIFLSGKDYESTIRSFEVLGDRIDSLVKDKNYANSNLLYFLDQNYILIGYNYKDPNKEMEGSIPGELLSEARQKIGSLCKGACMCIYKTNQIRPDSTPLQCKSFDKNIVFLAPSEQNDFSSMESGWNPKAYSGYYQYGENYKFLILGGFNTKEIYLDKYQSPDGNIFVFLAVYKNDPNDPIYKRKHFMEENYEKELQSK